MSKILPNAVAPTAKNIPPKTTSESVTRWARFLLTPFSPTRMKAAVRTGFMTKATNKDELKTIINVIGKYFMNSPMRPGQMAKGKNAASVVAVEAMMGQATSPTPCFAAWIDDFPSSISR